MNLNIPPEP